MDKALMLFTLSILFLWLFLDEIFGKKYIEQFIAAMIPFAS